MQNKTFIYLHKSNNKLDSMESEFTGNISNIKTKPMKNDPNLYRKCNQILILKVGAPLCR